MKQIVLIGFGRMGKMHFDILNALPELEVKYVVDHKAFDNIIPVTELESLLRSDGIDGVVITTSSDAHVEMIELCSRYQKKIFCETPISYQVDALQHLQKILTERGAEVQVGLYRRFDPHFSELKRRLIQGEIGEVQVVKITNCDPKRPDLAYAKRSDGLIYDFVIHDLDMVNFLCGAEVTDIAMMADAFIDPRLKKFNDVDTALINLKLDNGALVAIDVSRESGVGYDQRIEVLGQKGMLKVDNQYPTTLSHYYYHERKTDLPYYNFVERYHEAYQRQFKAYAHWLAGDIASPEVGVAQILSAIDLAERITALRSI